MINDASLVMIPSGYKDGKLYSVKPTDGSGDFTFSRGSNLAATRVNSEGLIEKGRENRLLQSNQFDTTWSKAGNLTSGQAGYDGTNDAWKIESSSIGQETRVRQSQTFTTGEVISLSVYMKKGNVNFGIVRTYAISGGGRAWFDLENGTVATENSGINGSIEDVGNGWYRCSIWGVINTTGSVDIAPAPDDNDYLSDAVGEFIYIQDAQLEAGLVATDYIETTTTTAQAGILEDMPRLNYGTCPSLLLEPQRTNLLSQSEYANSSNWANGGTTYTNNSTTSPDGGVNAIKLIEDNSTAFHYLGSQTSTSTSGSYTISGFVKKGSRRYAGLRAVTNGFVNRYFVLVDLDNGTVADTNIFGSGVTWSNTITAYANGWYRIQISGTHTSGIIDATFGLSDSDSPSYIGGLPTYNGSSGEYAYCYGLQIEAGSYPTSYIPTYGASVTRGADVCLKTSASSLIGQTEGTILVEIDVKDKTLSSSWAFSVNDGTTSNYIGLRRSGGNEFFAHINVAGSNTALIGTGITSGVHKIAIAYANNDIQVYVDGASVGTDTSSGIPTMSIIELGDLIGNRYLDDKIKQFALFPTRLSNDELAALTS